MEDGSNVIMPDVNTRTPDLSSVQAMWEIGDSKDSIINDSFVILGWVAIGVAEIEEFEGRGEMSELSNVDLYNAVKVNPVFTDCNAWIGEMSIQFRLAKKDDLLLNVKDGEALVPVEGCQCPVLSFLEVVANYIDLTVDGMKSAIEAFGGDVSLTVKKMSWRKTYRLLREMIQKQVAFSVAFLDGQKCAYMLLCHLEGWDPTSFQVKVKSQGMKFEHGMGSVVPVTKDMCSFKPCSVGCVWPVVNDKSHQVSSKDWHNGFRIVCRTYSHLFIETHMRATGMNINEK
jgi:hypothetical protein